MLTFHDDENMQLNHYQLLLIYKTNIWPLTTSITLNRAYSENNCLQDP